MINKTCIICDRNFVVLNIRKIYCSQSCKQKNSYQKNRIVRLENEKKKYEEIKANKITISEQKLSKNLQTKNIPDPDLLIRTGNTKRLSNFLLWQVAYSEIFFEKKLWPAFNEKDYNKIIKEYKKIKRNFGKI